MTDVVDPNLERCATCGKYFIQHVEKWSRYGTCGKFKAKVQDKLEGERSSKDKLEVSALNDKGQTGGCVAAPRETRDHRRSVRD